MDDAELLMTLYEESMELLDQFDFWDVGHVNRAENAVVVKIAKQQVERSKHART